MNGQKHFQLDILDGTWSSLRLGSELQPAWSALQAAHPSTVALTLTEDDVESYNWTEQNLTLSAQATQAIIAKFAQSDDDKAYPQSALDQHAFVVGLDGTPVYGGVFMHPMSSMGIDYPVIHASLSGGKLTFKLRPVQSVWGDYAAADPDWNGIKDPKIRDLFAKAGKLAPG